MSNNLLTLYPYSILSNHYVCHIRLSWLLGYRRVKFITSIETLFSGVNLTLLSHMKESKAVRSHNRWRGNEPFLIRVWKLLPSRRILKLWGWRLYVIGRSEQYLLAVDLSYYKWYHSWTLFEWLIMNKERWYNVMALGVRCLSLPLPRNIWCTHVMFTWATCFHPA